jgi:hypothetical protein
MAQPEFRSQSFKIFSKTSFRHAPIRVVSKSSPRAPSPLSTAYRCPFTAYRITISRFRLSSSIPRPIHTQKYLIQYPQRVSRLSNLPILNAIPPSQIIEIDLYFPRGSIR